MSTFENSEDPECCISSVSTLFVKVKKRSSDKIQFFKNYNLTPLDMYNGLSQVYCIKLEGKYPLVFIQRVCARYIALHYKEN